MARYGTGPQSSALAFNTLMLGQLLHALTCRSRQTGSAAGEAKGGGSMLHRSITGSIAVQVGANFLPLLRSMLGLGGRIGLTDTVIIMAGAGLPFLLNEAAKKGRLPASESVFIRTV
jgi:Ca2+-transporting ATPase